MFRHIRFIIRATCESNAVAYETLRYTLLCVCYVEAWCAPICLVTLPRTWQQNQTDRYIPGLHIRHITYNAESYQPLPSIRCNSAGTEELSDDETYVPKHVGATE
jgi:hypothetical protein